MLKSRSSITLIFCFFGLLMMAQRDDVKLAIQQGHLDDIISIDVSPTQTTFATLGKDNKVILWDYASGNQMGFRYVSTLARGVFYSDDSTLSVWNQKKDGGKKWDGVAVVEQLDLKTMEMKGHGQRLQVLTRHLAGPPENMVKVDGARLVLYDIEKKLKVRTSDYFDQPFTEVVYASDLKRFYVGCADGMVYVYDQNLKLLEQLKGHNADVNALVITPDKRHLLTASSDRSVIQWNLSDHSIDGRYTGKNFPSYGISLNNEGNVLMFGDEIGYLRSLDLDRTKLELESERVFIYPLRHTYQFRDGTVLLAGDDNKLIIRNGDHQEVFKNNYTGAKEYTHHVFTKRLNLYQPSYSRFDRVFVSPSERSVVFSNTIDLYKPNYLRVLDRSDSKWNASMRIYTKDEYRTDDLLFLNDSTFVSMYKNKLHWWRWDAGDEVQLHTHTLELKTEPEWIVRMNNDAILLGANKMIYAVHQSKGVLWSKPEENASHAFNLSNDVVLLVQPDHAFRLLYTNGEVSYSKPFVGHDDEITSASGDNNSERIFTTSKDGTVRIWDEVEQQLKLTIIPIGTDNCIYITPDNYYMMSKVGLDYFGFKMGVEYFYPDQFDVVFNRPDIVMQRIGGIDDELIMAYERAHSKRLKKLGYTEEMLHPDFHLPESKVMNMNSLNAVSNSSAVTIDVWAADKKYLLDRINVWVNGVAVFGTNGISLRDSNLHELRRSIDVPLAEGTNKVEVCVANQNGAESYKEVMEFENEITKRPDLYLVAIGVSEYRDERFNLRYASKDVQDLVNAFTQNSFFANVHTRTLTDEEVSLDSFRALHDFLKQAGINDQVVVFLAGHGVLDDNFDYYFASHAMDFNDPGKWGIAYEEIEALLDNIAPLKKVLFMDTCHSGEVDEEEVVMTQRQNDEEGPVKKRGAGVASFENREDQLGLVNTSELMNSLFADLRKGTGATVISASGGLEFALESNEWKNGLFTYCLLNGLLNEASDVNGDGEIWLSEIQKNVFSRVVELSGGQQQPTSRIANRVMDYRIW